MRKKKLKLTVTLLLSIGITMLYAQESIPASGGDASGSNGSVSWSVGQIVYSSYSGTNGSVWEGVQQPFEISTVVGINDSKKITLSVAAYPNPTSDYITLGIEEFELSNLSYQLFNSNGELLLFKEITLNNTRITMDNYVPATYLLRVISKNEEIKTFKIIKN